MTWSYVPDGTDTNRTFRGTLRDARVPGWRESNPAQWAEPPALSNATPVVATPAEIKALLAAAEESRRPEYARAILVAATTGLRRAELCALRWHLT